MWRTRGGAGSPCSDCTRGGGRGGSRQRRQLGGGARKGEPPGSPSRRRRRKLGVWWPRGSHAGVPRRSACPRGAPRALNGQRSAVISIRVMLSRGTRCASTVHACCTGWLPLHSASQGRTLARVLFGLVMFGACTSSPALRCACMFECHGVVLGLPDPVDGRAWAWTWDTP